MKSVKTLLKLIYTAAHDNGSGESGNFAIAAGMSGGMNAAGVACAIVVVVFVAGTCLL